MSGEGLIAEPRAVHSSVGHARLMELMHRGTEFLGCEVAIMGGASTLTFTVPTASLAHAVAALERAKGEIGFDQVMTDTDVVKVSAVGIGMRSNAGIAARMFETLAERGINILAISTSEIKVSVLLPEEYTELAVRVLHSAFALDAQEQAS